MPFREPVTVRASAASLLRFGLVANTPDRPARIVGDQQRPIFRHDDIDRASPYLGFLLASNPESCDEILVIACGLAICEFHTHDLVPSRLRSIPRALQCH